MIISNTDLQRLENISKHCKAIMIFLKAKHPETYEQIMFEMPHEGMDDVKELIGDWRVKVNGS